MQGLPEAHGAVQSHPNHPAQCSELPQAAQLAVVETLHKGQAPPTGHQRRGTEEGDGRRDKATQRPSRQAQV